MVEVSNSTLLARVRIGNLAAIKGAVEHEFLIGVIERVTRGVREELPDQVFEDLEEIPLEITPHDSVRVALIGTYRTIDGDAKNTFKRGADSFPQIERDCFYIQGANLQRFMGILGAGVPEQEKLMLGSYVVDRTAKAVISGDKFFQRHACILGSTGSGKSWAVALVLERANALKFPNILVFDMHGEYKPLVDQTKGGFSRGFRIAGPGDLDKPSEEVIFLPYWLLNRDELLSMVLDRSDQNAPNQASRFTLHVRKLKEQTLKQESKDEVAKTFTVDSPIPYDIHKLITLLREDNVRKGISPTTSKEIKGPWEGQLTRFLARLEAKLEDRRYGFMFQPETAALKYDWLSTMVKKLLGSSNNKDGIKVIDFSEVPNDVLPVVTATLARLLYDVQFWMNRDKRTPVTIVCDEAHLYLPVREDADVVEKQALSVFERIAKEGRKYGFSIVAVSQRPSDVSRTILSQCNNFLALRLTNEADQSVVKRLMPDSLSGITDVLPLLDTGECLLLGDAVLIPSRVRLDPPSVKPDSATKDFWREWGTRKPDDVALGEGIEHLRSQTRVAN